MAALLGTCLAVSGVFAAPGFAAPGPAAGAAGTTTGPASATAPTTTPVVTGSPVTTSPGTTGPSSDPTTSTCYRYTPPPTAPPGTPVVSYDFEDGTTRGWSGSGDVTATSSTDVAAGGSRSLRVAGLTTANTVGVSISSLPGLGWYQVTAKVRVLSPTPGADVVLRPVAEGGSVSGTAQVNANGWTTVSASFRPGIMFADWYCNGTMTGTQMPAPVTVQLSIAVVTPCRPVIDRPTTVYVDDVVVSTATAGTAWASTAPPTSGTGTGTTCGSTSPPPPAQCLASYRVQSQWPGGYTAVIDVRNLTTTAHPTWTLRWAFPDDQKIDTMWGATFTQVGRTVTVTSPSWAPLAASGAVNLGFVGSSTGTPGVPTSFGLDDQTCG